MHMPRYPAWSKGVRKGSSLCQKEADTLKGKYMQLMLCFRLFWRIFRPQWLLGLLLLCVGVVNCGTTCPEGQALCGVDCVLLKTDKTHCGQCGNTCQELERCVAGKCQLNCGSGQTLCGLNCVNVQADSLHCGGCGKACPRDDTCKNGVCLPRCQQPKVSCGTECVALSNNARHCGKCGNACLDGEYCQESKCLTRCPRGFLRCDGSCRDIQNDHSHCGKCGEVCAAGKRCEKGKCVVTCPKTLSTCGEFCANVQTDLLHCGKCGNACHKEQICRKGVCSWPCTSGATDCKGVCADLKTDFNHCGACGKSCKAGEICSAGKCLPCRDCPTKLFHEEGYGKEKVVDLVEDASGNLYVMGKYTGKMIVNTVSGTVVLTSTIKSAVEQLFILKYNAAGKIVWARHSENSYSATGTSIALAENGQSLYVSGYFAVGVAFGKTYYRSKGGYDILLLKMDKDGNFLWCQTYGGGQLDEGTSVVVDKAGNSYLTGQFRSKMAFGQKVLSNRGTTEAFIMKHDKDGKPLWSFVSEGVIGSQCLSRWIAIDGKGNVFITGWYIGKVTYGKTTLNAPGGRNYIFLMSFDPNGNVRFVRGYGSILARGDAHSFSLHVDAQGNVYAGGRFSETLNFTASVLRTAGLKDIWVGKWDNNGKFLWARRAGGLGVDELYSVRADNTGNVYITGFFSRQATFGETELEGPGSEVFLAKLNSASGWSGAIRMGGELREEGNVMHINRKGHVYVAGLFRAEWTFRDQKLRAFDDEDLFVAKFENLPAVLCPSQKAYFMCSQECINIQTHSLHCGRCQQVCSSQQSCEQGSCK